MKCFAGAGAGGAVKTVCGISFLLPQSSADIPPTPYILHPRWSLSHIPATESFGSDCTLCTLF